MENWFPSRYNAGVMTHDAESNPFASQTLVVVGVGLLGGSVAAAAKARRLARRVIGVGRDAARLEAARSAGLIDEWTLDVATAATRADFIVVCTPVDRIVSDVRAAADGSRGDALITDVGSVKGPVCRDLSWGLPKDVQFIGSHPLAGSEKQGFEYAEADLFEGRVCIITPDADAPRDRVERLRAFWQMLGASVIELSAEAHDRALAQTSHLPHVVASALATMLPESHRPLAATGFRDTTRIAAGDPALWTAILLGNGDAVQDSLQEYMNRLTQFQGMIAARDSAGLKELLQWGQTSLV